MVKQTLTLQQVISFMPSSFSQNKVWRSPRTEETNIQFPDLPQNSCRAFSKSFCCSVPLLSIYKWGRSMFPYLRLLLGLLKIVKYIHMFNQGCPISGLLGGHIPHGLQVGIKGHVGIQGISHSTMPTAWSSQLHPAMHMLSPSPPPFCCVWSIGSLFPSLSTQATQCPPLSGVQHK